MVLVVAALMLPMFSYSTSREGIADSSAQEESRAARTDLTDWRRTAAGWERVSEWQSDSPTLLAGPVFKSVDAVHPLVIAVLELLVSVAALLYFSPADPLRGKKVGVKSAVAKIA